MTTKKCSHSLYTCLVGAGQSSCRDTCATTLVLKKKDGPLVTCLYGEEK